MTFNPVDNLGYLIAKAWDVNEKITTTYVKANIDHSVGDVTIKGNFGIQAQHTDPAELVALTLQVGPGVAGEGGANHLPPRRPRPARHQQREHALARNKSQGSHVACNSSE